MEYKEPLSDGSHHPWVWMGLWESATGKREKQEFANSLETRFK